MCASRAGCRLGDLGAERCVCVCPWTSQCLNFLSEPLPDAELRRAALPASLSILDQSGSEGLTQPVSSRYSLHPQSLSPPPGCSRISLRPDASLAGSENAGSYLISADRAGRKHTRAAANDPFHSQLQQSGL